MEEKTAELQNEISERIEQQEKLRESEERFRTLVENVDDVIYTLNRNGEFTYVAPTWKKLLGHEPEEVIGTSFTKYVLPEDFGKCWEYVDQVFNLKKNTTAVEYRIFRKDGSIRWHASNASPFLDRQGAVTLLLGIGRDITSRKETEQKLRSHLDGLEDSIQSKDRYFSVLAHDLRSPFNIFLNLSELLSDEIESLSKDEIIKFSKQLNIALHKQYELLTDLLDWSGIQSNQLGFNPEKLLLYEEMMKVFDSVSAVAQDKKIELSCDVEGDFEVFADPRFLRTLSRNLVANSIKFTPIGGWVKITASQKGDMAEIVVSDNGIGMDSDLAANLFKT
ncbi:MAG: PAS domain-containing sensor histidine kinase [Ignavibacteriales bacterium]|nr:PAS domain-containing sensor histidine kinase [Ignavibacteriales bacterium]